MDSCHDLVAICCGGLEEQASSDIIASLVLHDRDITVEIIERSGDLQDSVNILNSVLFKGENGCGKLLIKTVACPTAVLSVRGVKFWLTHICHRKDVRICGQDKEAALAAVEELLDAASWSCALKTWSLFRDNGETRPSSFCGRCIRQGIHTFSSQDVCLRIGSVGTTKYGMKVNLTKMDCEIVVLIQNEVLIAGINVTNSGQPFLKNSFPSEIRAPVPAPEPNMPSLRPSMAYLLVSLASPKPNEIMIDCICGAGAGMFEASFGYKCIAVGGDAIGNVPIRSLKSGIESVSDMSKHRSVVELVLWSCGNLPLCEGSVDIAFINIPFRKTSVRIPRHHKFKVPKVVEEVARVLRPGIGRAIFLLQSPHQLLSSLNCIYFTHNNTSTRGVNIGGYVCAAVCAYRSERAFVAPVMGSDLWDRDYRDSRQGTKSNTAADAIASCVVDASFTNRQDLDVNGIAVMEKCGLENDEPHDGSSINEREKLSTKRPRLENS